MHLQTTEYEPPKYAEPASYNTWEELPKYKVQLHVTEVMLVLWRTCSPSAEGSCNTTMEASRTPKRTPVFCWRVELRRNASSRSAIHEIAIIKVSRNTRNLLVHQRLHNPSVQRGTKSTANPQILAGWGAGCWVASVSWAGWLAASQACVLHRDMAPFNALPLSILTSNTHMHQRPLPPAFIKKRAA